MILASLTPSQRLEVAAYVRLLRRTTSERPDRQLPGDAPDGSGIIAPSVDRRAGVVAAAHQYLRLMTAAEPIIRHAFTAFGGSRCEVIVCDGRQADVSAVVADTYAFERRLTRFDPASELSRFNAGAGAPVSRLGAPRRVASRLP